MRAPGERLRRLAARFCSPRTMERLIDPIVADLQAEYAAVRHASFWRRARVLTLAYAGLLKAVAVHCVLSAVAPPAEREGRPLLRIAAFSGAGLLVFISLLVAAPLEAYPWRGGVATRAMLLLTLLPQALPLSIPSAVCVGVACGLRARTIGARHLYLVLIVGLAASAGVWSMLEWGIPWGNQRFRELTIAMVGDGRLVHIDRGLNEQGLSTLAARTDAVAVHRYQLLWALCFASVPLGVFALGAAAKIRRLAPAVLTAFVAPYAYGTAIWMMAGWESRESAGVWTANALFLVAGLILLATRVRRTVNPEPRTPTPD